MKDNRAARIKVLKSLIKYETENTKMWEQKKLNEAAIAGLYKQLKKLKETNDHVVDAMGYFVSHGEKVMIEPCIASSWGGAPKKSKINEEFKVGDYVLPKSSYVNREGSVFTFKSGAYEIEKITGTHIYLKNVDYPYFEKDDLTLVCGFVKGEKIYANNCEERLGDNELIFNQYRPELVYPFECVSMDYKNEFKNGEPYNVIGYKYAKAIEEPKYKPYSEPNFEWVKNGNKVIHENKEHRIKSIGVRSNGVWFVCLEYKNVYTEYLDMQQFLDECTWLDGSPCGEKI
jgi:hypothetical protein